jgi:hypothetical protein
MIQTPPYETPKFKPKTHPVTLTDFVLQEIPRTEWAIEGIWPKGAKGIIAAPPKNGKSTISVELAVSLATGTPLFGVEKFKCYERARVTYVHQGENSAARIRKDFDLILQARGLGYMEDVLAHPQRTVNADREAAGLDPLDGPEGDELKMSGERFVPSWGDGSPHAVPDLELLVNPGLKLGSQNGALSTVGAVCDHREWLKDYAGDRDYLILDPIYMLAGISMNDEPAVIDLLGFLGEIHESGCAVIFTHQQSIKVREGGSDGGRMLGSTYLPAWLEAAMYPKRDANGLFTIGIDNLREMSDTDKVVLQGSTVGSWAYFDSAQNVEDSLGRQAPGASAKAVRMEQVRQMREENPDISKESMAAKLDVSVKSIANYLNEMAA